MAIKKVIEIQVKDDQAVKSIDNLNDSFKDTGESVDQVKKSTGDLKNNLGTMPGAGIFAGLKKGLQTVALGFKSVGTAILLSGLGLLVVTIVAVRKAFSASEEGQNKFAKLMGVIGTITGNLTDLLTDFGEFIISIFEDPRKAIQDFSKLIKENIVNRFEGILELIPALGKSIKLLFEGEFKEAGKVAGDAVAKVTLGVENFTNKVDGAINKVGDFIAENQKEAKIAAEIADARAKADKIERDLITERAEVDRRVAELRLKSRQEDKFTATERRGFIEEANALQDDIISKETEVLTLRRDALIQENTLSKSNKEAKDAEAEATAAVIRKETERANAQRTNTKLILSFNRQIAAGEKQRSAEADKKAAEDQKKADKKLEDDQKKEDARLKGIEDIRDKFQIKQENKDADTALKKIELEKERQLIELENLQATEEQKAEIITFFDDQITEQKKKNEDDLITKKIEAARKEEEEAAILAKAKKDLAWDTFRTLSNILGENTKAGKAAAGALVLAEQIASASNVIQNTIAANAKAVAASPLTFGQPWVGINTATAAIGIAGGIGVAGKAISDLGGGGSPKSASISNAGSRGAPTAPRFNVVGTSPENQLAQTIAAGQETGPQPTPIVKAIVVASDVTNQQALDRNILDTSTF